MKKTTIWFRSAMSASYEIGFMLVPIFVWVGAILSAGPLSSRITELPAWPFLALSLWANALRDSVKAFCCNPNGDEDAKRTDKYQREAVVTLSVVGLVCTCVLLTCTVLKSLGTVQFLWPSHQQLVWISLFSGAVLAWIAKVILVQRLDYGHYV
jgi:hypothetical protein